MKAKALKSFVSPEIGAVSEGDVFEMPKGADFIACGLAAAEPEKKATKKKATKKPTT